ncbi:MAG: hypothetical protein ACREE7_16855, partial [Dongiaceae bacterium]
MAAARPPARHHVVRRQHLRVIGDRGREWRRLPANLPTTLYDDLVIHPRDNDLIVATHGRSLWILDDLTPLA